MASHKLIVGLFISMIFVLSIKSLPLNTDDYVTENESTINLANIPSFTIHPMNFISLLCQQQEQYPIKLTRKICTNYIQTNKLQEQQQQQQQQQRGKRVGWTISV